MSSLPGPRPLRALTLLAGAWMGAHEVHAVLAPRAPDGLLFDRHAHLAVLFLAALSAAAGAWRAAPGERAAWGLVAAGLLSWACGEAYYVLVLWDMAAPPIPSPADLGYLTFPVLVTAGLSLLLRRRVREVPRTLWTDGITVGLAISSVIAAVVMGTMLEHVEGRPLAVAAALAYPVTDMLLLSLIAGALAGMGWRVDRRWAMLAAGIGTFWLADSLYAIKVVQGTYVSGGWFDIGWWAGLLCIGLAPWAPAQALRPHDGEAMRLIAVPLGFGTVGLGVLVHGNLVGVNRLATGLAAASLIAVMARLMLTFRANVLMLRHSRDEATTDPLTGLGNRRALARALEQGIAGAGAGDPLVLVLFDLDGFKHYNDTFGHPAGDALLARLGSRLDGYVGERGQAFRMGGDEFCALLRPGAQPASPIVAGAAVALSERGDGFSIGCSFGSIELPREARDAEEALRLADQRMYAHKHGGRRSAGRQSADVLLRVLAERYPDLGEHSGDVAALAVATAERLGLAGDGLARVRHAAELHDVGKVAIPDTILDKPGPLDDDEWAFMRRHTVIGERIVAAAPALEPVARLVRASHERWDGSGYPDGLAGKDIPLGARIVSVADAYDAMVTTRPYRAGMDPEPALAELRQCAGTQFDPAVVAAFCVVAEGRAAALPAAVA